MRSVGKAEPDPRFNMFYNTANPCLTLPKTDEMICHVSKLDILLGVFPILAQM